MWLLIFLVCLLICAGSTYWYLFGKPSPFSLNSVRPPAPREFDQKKRDKVIKQGFSVDKVPKNLDVIVIGSGIGGLTAGATLAKAGKKVLVLEQHDQAGGCCHTYIEKGFEFDVGLHYIGQLHENSLLRIAFDQISEGQLEFHQLDQHFDTIQIGLGNEKREYTIYCGKTEMKAHLMKQFPDDTEAIDKFFKIMKISAKKTHYLATLKLIPQWVSLFLLKSGIADLISPVFRLSGTCATDFVNTLTSNKDLHTIFSYFFYGVPPKDSSVLMNALMIHHYKRGAYYPKGGASEIPFHIIRTIQKYGGNCLVRAPVSQILVNEEGAAYGVKVRKGQEEVEIHAPVVVSNCGIFNTFQKLLPPEIQAKPDIQQRLNMMKHGRGSLLVFSGFDGTKEELDLVSTNFWLFKDNDMDKSMEDYFGLSREEAPDNIPMIFITVPSSKDPEAKIRHPGKSCMTILTMVNYEWFEQWKDTTVRKRGDEYYNYKMRFAKNLFDWACTVFPKIKDKLVFQDVATPLTNMHYLGAQHGAMYSAEHNLERFHAEAVAKNRCNTPVKNLYISGQDVFSNGIAGALHGGLLCACAVLDRIIYIDLLLLKKKLKRRKARELAKLAQKKLQ
ncbi:inactive all-trans-retinol 13,14-reductase isoform X1 [Haplochromis burtoni]|uniref:Retinol saturase (all-trans-retinol 13,14-reductase) like n=2 Tax=Haplochromini TaxID=319058 RepID=A0A3Q2WHJ4_HAPBU|nr:putative all-trans-retinol 13,14-reductase [Maylandia zebra]XP_014190844.2 inactive all-trans-retinol 13,14-reductase isoform X1 [Haplochromis burtoni]XP_042080023.1 inactive all-trans-retinol 13,14-reductase isoform X1 [Haplochromis burtoni]